MRAVTTLLLTLITIELHAQKLPNVQQGSVKAPSDIKIDGKANDWGNRFRASNSATELQYTIANDDKKLYLVVQTTSVMVMNRIASGGLKLVIQKNGTKTDAGASFIKFPFLEKGKRVNISFVNIRKIGKNGMERVPEPKSPIAAEKIYDSLARDNNKKLTGVVKWIYTSGIAGVDTLLAIYNDKGIEVANAFDSKKTYICEIAVDLKLLGLQADKSEKFTYQVVVNGEPHKYVSPFVAVEATGANGSPMQNDITRMIAETSATTDFWGEYTLAK